MANFFTPDLTSNTSHSPVVVTSSHTYGGCEAYHLFDNNINRWMTDIGLPVWAKVDLGVGNTKTLYEYKVQNFNDNYGGNSRAPKTWVLEGSNDDTNWTTLDSQVNQTTWGIGEIRSFTISDVSTAYRYWRLTVTANNGDGSYMHIAELSLFDAIEPTAAKVTLADVQVAVTGATSKARVTLADVQVAVTGATPKARVTLADVQVAQQTFGWNFDSSLAYSFSVDAELVSKNSFTSDVSFAFSIGVEASENFSESAFNADVTYNFGISGTLEGSPQQPAFLCNLGSDSIYRGYLPPYQISDVTFTSELGTPLSELALLYPNKGAISSVIVNSISGSINIAGTTSVGFSATSYHATDYRRSVSGGYVFNVKINEAEPHRWSFTDTANYRTNLINPTDLSIGLYRWYSPNLNVHFKQIGIFLKGTSWDTDTQDLEVQDATGALGASTVRSSGEISVGTRYSKKLTYVKISPANYRESDIAMDGSTAVSIHAASLSVFHLTADGRTAVALAKTNQIVPAHFAWTPLTSIAFSAEKMANARTDWTTSTDFSISTAARYSLGWSADGKTDFEIISTFKQAFVYITASGKSDLSISTILSAVGNVSLTTSTSIRIIPKSTISCRIFIDAVGDMNITARRSVIGNTNWTPSTSILIEAYSEIYGEVGTGGQGDFYALGTYIYDQTEFHIVSNVSDMVVNSAVLSISADWFTVTIVKKKEFGAEFASIPVESFFVDVKSAVTSQSLSGSYHYKLGQGFTRPTTYDDIRKQVSNIGLESAKFELLPGLYATYDSSTSVYITQAALETLYVGESTTRLTQVAVGVLFKPTSKVRITNVVVETMKLANFAAVNQIAIEKLRSITPGITPARINQLPVEMLASIKSSTQITQAALEVMCFGDSSVHLTQSSVEMLTQFIDMTDTKVNINQVNSELLSDGDPYLTINQATSEMASDGDPYAVINQIAEECMHNGHPDACVNAIAVEKIRNGPYIVHVNGLAVEMLVRIKFDPTVSGLVNNPKFHS